MIKDLVKLANHLDSKGLKKEADYLDAILKKSFAEPASIATETATGLLPFGERPITRNIYVKEIQPAIHQWVKQQIFVQTGKQIK